MILRRTLLLISTLVLPYLGWSQGFNIYSIPHNSQAKVKNSGARTQAVTLTLPFWDDFSHIKGDTVDTGLWLYGKSVLRNEGMAINPPSLGVVTFDGIDSVGKPYNVTDVLAKGYADKLVSQSIDLTTVPEAERGGVYFSYEYQMQGNGEMPDEGDRLLLSFYDSAGEWIPVDTIDNDGSLDPTVFYTSIVPINEGRFYHDEFKFMIKNFGRLSGPYDAWNVDYIYINKGRTATDYSFPDRAISTPMTSLFGGYRSIPVNHFLLKKNDIITYPKVVVTNNRADQILPAPPNAGSQPVSSITTAHIAYRENKIVTKAPTFGPNISPSATGVAFREFKEIALDNLPSLDFSPLTDSISIELVVGFQTKDNLDINNSGDYDPAKWAPIDFRVNDTTRTNFVLTNKYAYDDGTAEYGAGLNQPGAQVAYRFDLVGVEQENITFLEMYFPRFGDETSQVIELRIWDSTFVKKDPVYTQQIALQRSEGNKFWVQQLTRPVPVGKTFFIGWKQSTTAVIAVGLDKNTDNFDKMYYNTTGSWDTSRLIHGSLMMRPIFGKGPARDTTGIEESKLLTLYPNPGNGTFYVQGQAEAISVFDVTGRLIPHVKESTSEETIITIPDARQGVYIIRAYIAGAIRTRKVLIR